MFSFTLSLATRPYTLTGVCSEQLAVMLNGSWNANDNDFSETQGLRLQKEHRLRDAVKRRQSPHPLLGLQND